MGWREVPSAWPESATVGSRNDQIGARSLVMPVQATRIDFASAGSRDLVFLEEVDLQECFVPREVDSKSQTWRRFRLELRTRDKSLKGQHLVLAWHPYSVKCYSAAAVKGPLKKDRVAAIDRLAASDGLSTLLGGAAQELFESDAFYTAALSEPPPFFDPPTGRKLTRPDYYYLALCRDYNEYKDILIGSPEVRELWRMTQELTLRFSAGHGARLYPHLVPDCYSILFELSVSQALAGPGRESSKWRGRKVTDLIDHVYRNHVNNLNRRAAGEPEMVSFDEELDGEADTDADG